jgi:nucleoside-diphosphate-sugar epimerase
MVLKIAVTGATGFAGRHALRALISAGHRICALAREPRRLQEFSAVEAVAGDLLQPASLEKLVSGTDVVVHLAGAIAARSRAEFHAINVEGTKLLADAAKRAGVRRFIHVSSMAAREPQLSAYGESKRAGEAAISEWANAIILRPPIVYGPRDRGALPLFRLLVSPVALIPGRASARFSVIYVEDLASIIASLVENDKTGLHEIHDGKPGGYGWQDLISIARHLEGAPKRAAFLPKVVPLSIAYAVAPLRLVSPHPMMITPGKIRELYHDDWTCRGGLTANPPTGLADGFAKTAAWYRKEGWLPDHRHADKSRASANYGESPK